MNFAARTTAHAPHAASAGSAAAPPASYSRTVFPWKQSKAVAAIGVKCMQLTGGGCSKWRRFKELRLLSCLTEGVRLSQLLTSGCLSKKVLASLRMEAGPPCIAASQAFKTKGRARYFTSRYFTSNEVESAEPFSSSLHALDLLGIFFHFLQLQQSPNYLIIIHMHLR